MKKILAKAFEEAYVFLDILDTEYANDYLLNKGYSQGEIDRMLETCFFRVRQILEEQNSSHMVAKSRNFSVSFLKEMWAVKRAGSTYTLAKFLFKKDAISYGKKRAKKSGGSLRILNKKGHIIQVL